MGMRTYLKLIVVVLWLQPAISCKKILDVQSPNAVADDAVLTTASGVRNARIGLYISLQDKNYYGAYFPLLADCYSDNGTTGGYNVIDLNDIAARTVGPANIYVQNIYAAIYNSIHTANKIIGAISTVPGMDDAEKSQINGEALFIRALGHFDLLRMFGEHWDRTSAYGISLSTGKTDPLTPIARSSVDDSYKQILNDLQQSIIGLGASTGSQFISQAGAKALLARVLLYAGELSAASVAASAVIDDGNYSLFGPDEFTKVYTQKLTPESIFELKFDPQNPSAFNTVTYARPDALRSEILFLANADLNEFFLSRPDDRRQALVDYVHVDVSIQPDGRTEKYRGETTKDNSSYIIRLAEMYLIRAEASGKTDGLADLNTVRAARGMMELTSDDVSSDEAFLKAVLDERRAELNFEGHRLFDLARTGKVSSVLGTSVNPIMPIPQREIDGTGGVVKQNSGY